MDGTTTGPPATGSVPRAATTAGNRAVGRTTARDGTTRRAAGAERSLLLRYSSRNALVGSSDAARRAGSQHATTAITRKSSTMLANVIGSVGATPTSMLVITRVSTSAPTTPITSPATLSRT